MVTPSDAAERLISFLERHNSKHHWLSQWSADDIRQQAAAATERYAAGNSLSVFDGVPFCVKDMLDALPYETSYGTKYMGQLRPCSRDAPAVETLKGLGAILIGKSAMNEFGVLPHGFNAQRGSTKNPHDPSRMTGGSSAGSATAVAVGLCPVAIGTDGGGSIRIPSAYCGVAGLKPTQGRLASDHRGNGGYSTVIVSGPIANSISDLTLMYAVMANRDYPKPSANGVNHSSSDMLPGVATAAKESEPLGLKPLGLPKTLLPLRDPDGDGYTFVIDGLQPLKGLRVGVYREWNAACAPAVADVVKETLSRLEALGATIVDIVLPEMELTQTGHLVAIAKEMAADAEHQGWLHDWKLRGQLNLDTRMFFANAVNFTDDDYTQAQRMRTRALSHFEGAWKKCDVILTPATPTPAPKFPQGANTTGVYDLAATLKIIQYMQPANLLGYPALVMPGGRQMGIGLPIGVQFIGKPFAESVLLRTAAALEQYMSEHGMPRPIPVVNINPIQCEKGAHPKAAELTKKLWAKRYAKSAQ
eukprot:GHUV01006799.1.p1 GENE.GHUV01006799.1~~GHUV01006799.1.p1  ORF type:complete len:531 (+),score=146.49 GHUV01006799.1:664-2256(+)